MSKYAPLGAYLRGQRLSLVPMTFADIERITGVTLPPKAQLHRAWWSNNPSNSVMTKVWLDAGYRTEQVDMAARKLVFRRVNNAAESTSRARAEDAERTPRKRHPLQGALKGLIKITPGTDLTKPADPSWGEGP